MLRRQWIFFYQSKFPEATGPQVLEHHPHLFGLWKQGRSQELFWGLDSKARDSIGLFWEKAWERSCKRT